MLDDSLDETEHLHLSDHEDSDSSDGIRPAATTDDMVPYFRSLLQKKDDMILSLKKELHMVNLSDAEISQEQAS